MATETDTAELSPLQLAVLDAVQRNFVYVSDVLDYCGPRFSEEDRGMDSSSYMLAVETLVNDGYLERAADRGTSQLELRLTERGRQAAPELPALDRELLEAHGVTTAAVRILRDVIDHVDREGAPPSITDLQHEDDEDWSAYQYSLQFSSLVRAGLASERGILRYHVEPTSEGRDVVSDNADRL